MAIEYNFTLDMDRSKRDNNIAYARTGDVDSITINADLVLNGAAYTPTGANAFFECITPNGHSIRVAASKTGSTVSVDVPSAAFQAAGVINVAYFRFESGEADNPTYVESTEPFAIVVREGIGDNIDAGDYIEEWRALADQLEAIVAEVEQKAEQAETAINEQKAEVDQLKAQVQVSMAQDAEDVSDAKDTAISNINGSQGAVDAAIDKLEQKTQEAVDAAQEALDGTLATDLQNKIDRTLKLDIADMVDISSNTSLSSLTSVGSYCCKTAAAAATISDSPVDDSPFNMYVFSSSTSGQVMQLVVPIDLNSKPTAEWHVRFGTSSAMDPWSVIGGGADIAAGLGIDVTGDAKKTVAIDTTAFYQHHEAAEVIQGSTEVTGGGRIKELVVYGNTRQNLWVNPSGTSSVVTVTSNDDGSMTVGGTANGRCVVSAPTSYVLKPGEDYTVTASGSLSDSWEILESGAGFNIQFYNSSGKSVDGATFGYGQTLSKTFTFPSSAVRSTISVVVESGSTVSGTYRVMLNEGSEALPWCPPWLNGVDELSVVCAGKNLFDIATGTANGVTLSKNDDSTYTLSGTCTAVTFFRSSGVGGLTSEKAFPDGTYALSVSVAGSYSGTLFFRARDTSGVIIGQFAQASGTSVWTLKNTSCFEITVPDGFSGSAVIRVQLELGSTATDYEPPSITTTPVDLDGHALNSLPDGTRDELRIDGTGAVTLVQRVGVYVADGDEGWELAASDAAPYRMRVNNWSANALNGLLSPDMFISTVLPASNTDGYENGSYVVINGRYQLYAGRTGITTADDFSTWLETSPMTVLYPLAAQQEVELPEVSIPDLASPSYIIYANSNVPAEIEAEVVKVDYLPAPDVYTKQEVDQKIEASSMPDVVPVSKGGTGVTTAAAERNRLGLGNTTGALPIANGGTGATTAKAAQYNLLNDAIQRGADENINDETNFALFTVSASTTNGAVQKFPALNIWNYVATKIRSVFGFSSSNVLTLANGGTSATSSASARSNLNVYSKAEVDGKVPKVVYGTGNIPSSAANGTIYIQYRS